MDAIESISSLSNEESTALSSHLEPAQKSIADGQAPSSTACISCRERHVKCDGLPTCSRCAAQGLKCVYLKSRRGCRPTGQPRSIYGEQLVSLNSRDTDMALSEAMSTYPLSIAFTPSPTTQLATSSIDMTFEVDTETSSQLEYSRFSSSHRQNCIDAFYHYCYDAHPFLPPRQHLLQVLRHNPLEHLQTAMCFAGSRYVSGSSMAAFAIEFEPYLAGTKAVPRDASTIQAMLLFAISLDGNNERARATGILTKAQRLAVELGMNQPEYAVLNGQGSSVCEESLRRTWWELYVVNIVVAAFQDGRTAYHGENWSSVSLPCEEAEFVSGFIPEGHTLDEFDDNTFDRGDIAFSSYAYRIAAARNLNRILQAQPISFRDDAALPKLEAYLTNWHLYLPEEKREPFDQYGNFDEMSFQAQMIANVSTLILYRHFSHLDTHAAHTMTFCKPSPSSPSPSPITSTTTTTTTTTPPLKASLPTHATLTAAAHLSKLVTLPFPLQKHTHLFICALTLSSIAHLSSWATMSLSSTTTTGNQDGNQDGNGEGNRDGEDEKDVKEQIRMNAGALKAVAGVWPAARVALEQMMGVARGVYRARRREVVMGSGIGVGAGYGTGNVGGEMVWRDWMEEGEFMGGLIGSVGGLEEI